MSARILRPGEQEPRRSCSGQGKRRYVFILKTYPFRSLIFTRPVERVNLKRVPVLPRGAYTVSVADNTPQTIVPVRYETTI